MSRVVLAPGARYEDWRAVARPLLLRGVEPETITWESGDAPGLFGTGDVDDDGATPRPGGGLRVPREFPSLVDDAIAHTHPQRHALAYRLLWRLNHGEPALLRIATDADVLQVRSMAKAVARDVHKMHAFVRFREVAGPDGEPVFVARFEPDHYIVERAAPFFVRRFTGMRWSILTPYRSAHWDGEQLSLGDGASRADAPGDDALETLWRTYYASIFNPARLKVRTMTREMPVRYWKNLPEARLIPTLVRDASPRVQEMVDQAPTEARRRIAAPLPRPAPLAGTLEALRDRARGCRACDLWKPATQTVFGEGPPDARVMLVGEQPGDQEDLAGRPFIGPAGRLLDRALVEAGLDRRALYVTNAVKHFKFQPRGKTRLHQRANAEEQRACRPWLDAQIAQVRPRIIVCLGAMAASQLLGSAFRLLDQRGEWHALPDGTRVIATVHPAYLLRLPGGEEQARAYAAFVEDLERVGAALKEADASAAGSAAHAHPV